MAEFFYSMDMSWKLFDVDARVLGGIRASWVARLDERLPNFGGRRVDRAGILGV